MASAGEPHQSHTGTLRVFVMNQAHVRPEVLRAAEDDAAAIFVAAGVQLVWLDETSAVSEPFDVTVKITAGMKPSMLPGTAVGDLSLGFAAVKPTGEGIRGYLAWVFIDQVQTHAEHSHIQISRLCGLVMAHELGHLVLPAGHADQGLMRGTWDLRAGLLQYFTDAQADAIRARLAYGAAEARNGRE
jgi:hypothetical protein